MFDALSVAAPPVVLVVDDDDDVRLLARMLLLIELSPLGVDVRDTDDPEYAVQLCLPPGHVDVMVLDMHMPKMRGLEVLRRLNGHQGTPTVIAWSADDIELQRALKLGATLALPKLSGPERLVAAVSACLELSGLRGDADLPQRS